MKDRTPQQSSASPASAAQDSQQQAKTDFGSNAATQEGIAGSTDQPGLLDSLLGAVGVDPDDAQDLLDSGADLIGDVVDDVGDVAAGATDLLGDAGEFVYGLGESAYDTGVKLVDAGIDLAEQLGSDIADTAIDIGEAIADLVMGPLDLLITTDKSATEASLAPWAGMYGDTIEFWGHTFSDDRVRLEEHDIVLRWSTSWGPVPVTKDLAGDDIPVDAKAAVGGMHKLSGWGELEAADQGRLEALVGGETNALSFAARGNLYGQWSTIQGQGAADQATSLSGLLTSEDSKPGLVSGEVNNTAAPYTLAGPIDEEDHAFRGATADAEVWTESFTDETGGSITLYAPKELAEGVHQHTVQQAADAAALLPPASRAVVTSVTLNPVVNPDDAHWASEYNDPDFHSYMTAGASGEITIYADSGEMPDEEELQGSMIHETGHTWSKQQWGQDTTSDAWKPWRDAMASDGVSVSTYADNSVDEDVAETIQVYGSTYNTPAYDEYAAMVPARFAILDREMGH